MPLARIEQPITSTSTTSAIASVPFRSAVGSTRQKACSLPDSAAMFDGRSSGSRSMVFIAMIHVNSDSASATRNLRLPW